MAHHLPRYVLCPLKEAELLLYANGPLFGFLPSVSHWVSAIVTFFFPESNDLVTQSVRRVIACLPVSRSVNTSCSPNFPPFPALTLYCIYAVVPLLEREKNLVEWVRRHVPSQPVEDLQRDLKDGLVLCGLLEALVPGSCPRYDLLSRENPTANLHIASRLSAAFLGVTEVIKHEKGLKYQ